MAEQSPERSFSSRKHNAFDAIRENLDYLEKNLEPIEGIRKILEQHDCCLTRSARELVDGKPAFAGLLHLHNTVDRDRSWDAWQGITLHAQDRPFTVRVLMQHIRTAVSNHHPDKRRKGIDLEEVGFIWNRYLQTPDNPAHSNWKFCLIRSHGGAGESTEEDALVRDNLEAMMVRGEGHIFVKYHLKG